MKKHVIILLAFAFGLLCNSIAFAEEAPKEKEHGHHYKLIEPEKAKELKEKGYSKEDIFMAAILGKKSAKNIDDVLAIYKDKESWEKTAEELNIDEEDFKRIEAMCEWKKFVKENKQEVLEYLAEYTGKETSDIKQYKGDGYKLHFLIAAGALAKTSDKSFDEIIALKKEGTSFHKIMKDLDVNEEDLHKELEQFKDGVTNKVQETP